jgi:cell division protein FtsQ
MTDSNLMTAESLKNHRQSLQNQRRLKAWQGVWRFIALCGMTGGLIWSVNLPHWLIREKSQVKIMGNERLNQAQIQKMLQMSYPQFIWELPIHELKEQLEEQPPIKAVYLTRELLPVEVTIMVKERQPVAEAIMEGRAGFLDAEGVWIPQTFYQPEATVKPTVKIKALGLDQQSLAYWKDIYPFIVHSPVKIMAIDWRNPSNLILETELGKVHCGTYGEQFSQQLTALAKLRSSLPSQMPKERIVYIDLSNPDEPLIDVKEPPKTPLKQEIPVE